MRPSVATLMLALAVELGASTAHAWCQATTDARQPDPRVCPSRGMPLAWPGGCAGISIDPRVLPPEMTAMEFQAQVDAAALMWAEAPCPSGGTPSFRLTAYPSCPHRAEYNRGGPNANTVSFRPIWGDDEFHPPEAIAVTVTSFARETGEIRDSDTEINLRSPDNPGGFVFTGNPAVPNAADLPSILLHELGHAQGLAHTAEEQAVMWYNSGRGEQRRQLLADDIEGVCTVYPPGRQAPCDPEPYRGFQCASNGGCRCSLVGARPAPGAHAPWLAAALALGVGALVRRLRR